MKKFDKLKNGATVLHQHDAPNGDSAIVLCKWDGALDPYVTWIIGPDGSAFSGHYFSTIEAAVNEYEQRAGVKLDDPMKAPEVVREVLYELECLMEGEDCDHDTGICYCTTFRRMEMARDFLRQHGIGDDAWKLWKAEIEGRA